MEFNTLNNELDPQKIIPKVRRYGITFLRYYEGKFSQKFMLAGAVIYGLELFIIFSPKIV